MGSLTHFNMNHEIDDTEAAGFIVGKDKHPGYHITVDIADHLDFHFNGYDPENPNPWFVKIIDVTRPGEEEKWKAYRKLIYKGGKTKRATNKVYTSLKKGYESEDWAINWPKNRPDRLPGDDGDFEAYITKNYPLFGDIQIYHKSQYLKRTLIDPNAYACIGFDFTEDQSAILRPVEKIIPSKNVLRVGEWYVFKLEKQIKDEKNRWVDVFWVMDSKKIQIWTHGSNDDGAVLQSTSFHDLGFVPARKLPGEFFDVVHDVKIDKSFLDPMLDSLDEAARESSDLQAAKVQHLFPTQWTVKQQNCIPCKGIGKIHDPKGGALIDCTSCNGSGALAFNPFIVREYDLPEAGQTAPPYPWEGFVEKDKEIIKLQAESVNANVFDALAAINFEFLDTIGLSQSGVAKEVDREEANVLTRSIFAQLVAAMSWTIEVIGELRHSGTYSDQKKRKTFLPTINVPRKFDLLNANSLFERLKTANEAGVSRTLLQKMNLDIANKVFANDDSLRKRVQTTIKLDPLDTFSIEEIGNLSLDSKVTDEDFVLHVYLNHFIEQAIEKDDGFLDLSVDDQSKIVDKMLDEKMIEITGVDLTLGVDGIVTPIDVEAEAKAKLKGTVGGVNGIIEINKAVSVGTMSEQSAEALLVLLYGFSKEEADTLIEAPEITPELLARVS